MKHAIKNYLCATLTLAYSFNAQATFSIVATDAKTGQVGGGLASCTAFLRIVDIENSVYASIPGVGVVHGQSFFFNNKKDVMMKLLYDGLPAKRIIDSYIYTNSPTADPNHRRYLSELLDEDSAHKNIAQRRQYGLATIQNGAASAFTGNSNEPLVGTPLERGDDQGHLRRYRFSVQGNTLKTLFQGRKLVLLQQMKNEFRKGRGQCDDLAQRLYSALMAGGKNGMGDKRCVDGDRLANPNPSLKGLSSNQGYLRVDDPNRGTILNLNFMCEDHKDPAKCGDALIQLDQQYRAWRAVYGCPDH